MHDDNDLPERFLEILDRLCRKSVDDYYNPFLHFSWPATLPTEAYWMTPSLMSAHGTQVEEEMSRQQLVALSRWESINFYSMNVHGIRELIIEVVNRIHTPGFEAASEFFHHFVGEENEHMWFFSEFCLRYGGKIYPTMSIQGSSFHEPEISNLLVFSRILLFEEVVDFYNTTMAADTALHETIREVNRMHHQDESRHIAFGRELVALLFRRVRDTLSEERHREIETYLKRYLAMSFQSLCNARVYKDAGIPDPYQARRRVLGDQAWQAANANAARKPMAFFTKMGIFRDPELLTV